MGTRDLYFHLKERERDCDFVTDPIIEESKQTWKNTKFELLGIHQIFIFVIFVLALKKTAVMSQALNCQIRLLDVSQ